MALVRDENVAPNRASRTSKRSNTLNKPSIASGSVLSHASVAAASVDTLVARLQAINKDLSALQNDVVDRAALAPLAADLLSPVLLQHRDRSVRVLTACCLADILRLFAPDAPYSQAQLRSIFELFVRELEHVGRRSDPFFAFDCYLLDSLSTVRTCVLVNDLNADELVYDFFRVLFKAVAQDTPKSVYIYMLDILKELISESTILPVDVIELIFSFFRRKRQTEHPNAFRLAVELCAATADKLQRYACQYFSEKIFDDVRGRDFLKDPTKRKEFERAHRLIIELGKHVPDLLTSVVPLLETELTVADSFIRVSATRVLGELFSLSGTNYARAYPSTWRVWLGRFKDQVLTIRAQVVEYSSTIMSSHPTLVADLDIPWRNAVIDREVEMRIVALQTMRKYSSYTLRHLSTDLLKLVGPRMLDKKPAVRQQAVETLGHIFSIKYPEIASDTGNDFEPESKYMWIPGAMLSALYGVRDDLALRASIDLALVQNIFPPDTDDESRTNRLLHVLSSFDASMMDAFVNFLSRQAKSIEKFTLYINICEIYNGGTVLSEAGQLAIFKKYGNSEAISMTKETLETVATALIKLMASLLPDSNLAENQLRKLLISNDQRVYKLSRVVIDPKSELSQIVKCKSELVKRLVEIGIVKPNENTIYSVESLLNEMPPVPNPMITMINRVALTVLSKGTIPVCMSHIYQSRIAREKTQSSMGDIAEKLLKIISDSFPILYQSNLDKLIELVNAADENSSQAGMLDEACEALCRYIKSYPETIDSLTKHTLQQLTKIAIAQRSAVQVSSSITILAYAYKLSAADRQDLSRESCVKILASLMEKLVMPSRSTIKLESLSLEGDNSRVLEESDNSEDSSEDDAKAVSEDPSESHGKHTRASVKSSKRKKHAKAVAVASKYRRSQDRKEALITKVYVQMMSKLAITLTGLGEFMYYLPGMIEEKRLLISNFVVKNIILSNEGFTVEKDVDWKEFSELPIFGQLKIISLKMLCKLIVRRTVAWAAEETNEEQDPEHDANDVALKKTVFFLDNKTRLSYATSILRLYRKIIVDEGELLSEQDKTPTCVKSAMRLEAASCLLSMATDSELCKIDDMLYIALPMQDPVFRVRSGITSILCGLLERKEVPFKYVTLFSIIAHDPEASLKNKVRTFLVRITARQRKEAAASLGLPSDTSSGNTQLVNFRSIASNTRHPLVEHTLPRLVYLLSKHPDFSASTADLPIFVRYIEFYLEAIISADCVSFLYYVMSKLKMYRDVDADMAGSANIYLLSEATQLLIQKKAKAHQWSLDPYNGHAMVTLELFAKLSPLEATENARKRYLPDGFKV